jgi:hypothetical protein
VRAAAITIPCSDKQLLTPTHPLQPSASLPPPSPTPTPHFYPSPNFSCVFRLTSKASSNPKFQITGLGVGSGETDTRKYVSPAQIPHAIPLM